MVSSDKDIMSEIASDDLIERAYGWLCERRKDYSANNDVWHLRLRWQAIRPRLQADVLSGQYRLGAEVMKITNSVALTFIRFLFR